MYLQDRMNKFVRIVSRTFFVGAVALLAIYGALWLLVHGLRIVGADI